MSEMSTEAQEEIQKNTNQLLKEVLLSDIREKMNLTQADIAKRLNTKQANVS
jgi:DNA-binding transcriptional regulator YiaG